ncbi:MAG: helix-turn-helix transcriptional regulator [Ruminococcus sp.]|nr:helix-turn-helix transcriptional regulator [Ruminococcus sp.]
MNADFEKKVGNNIRAIREKRRMTQEQLSAKLQISGCDITRSALAKIEVGQRHIYVDELKLIIEILHTDFNSLVL